MDWFLIWKQCLQSFLDVHRAVFFPLPLSISLDQTKDVRSSKCTISEKPDTQFYPKNVVRGFLKSPKPVIDLFWYHLNSFSEYYNNHNLHIFWNQVECETRVYVSCVGYLLVQTIILEQVWLQIVPCRQFSKV